MKYCIGGGLCCKTMNDIKKSNPGSRLTSSGEFIKIGAKFETPCLDRWVRQCSRWPGEISTAKTLENIPLRCRVTRPTPQPNSKQMALEIRTSFRVSNVFSRSASNFPDS